MGAGAGGGDRSGWGREGVEPTRSFGGGAEHPIILHDILTGCSCETDNPFNEIRYASCCRCGIRCGIRYSSITTQLIAFTLH